MAGSRSNGGAGGPSHFDIGRLDQRVKGTEDSLKAISSDVAGLRADNVGLRADMATSMTAMSAALGTKIDQIATSLDTKIAANAAKPQDWRSIIGLMFAGFTLFGGFWAYTKGQDARASEIFAAAVAANETRIETMVVAEAGERKQSERDLNTLMQPILAAVAQQKNDAKRFDDIEAAIKGLWEKEWPKEAQVEYEARIDDHNALVEKYAERDLKESKEHINTVDANQIRRPEIDASQKSIVDQLAAAVTSINDRITAISARANDTEKEVHSGWSLSDTVKSLELRIENLRAQFGTALIPAAAAPVMQGK